MRQNFIGLTLCAMLVALCSFAEAHQEAVPPRVGMIRTGTPPDALLDIFLQGLRDLGYVDGKNILIELRFAEGKPARAAEIAKELAGLKIDAVFTASTPAILAFKHATKAIPMVMVSTTDPVRSGIVTSLGHPGGDAHGRISDGL